MLFGHLLRHNKFITTIMERKINSQRTRRKPAWFYLKKSSVTWVLPLTKNSRGWNVTDMNGCNNKAWPLKADDEVPKVNIAITFDV